MTDRSGDRNKTHLVTKDIFRQEIPLPTVCGSMKATSVTVKMRGVTCKLCKRAFK